MRTTITRTMLIPTNGIRLHVEAAGPEDGPLVILLHGFPEFWYGWANQIEPLAHSGLLVAAPDMRGYGLSDKPQGIENYRKDVLAKDIVGLIDYFGRERAVIVGHDWGGVIAWHLAIYHPDRVERLVALNAPHPAAFNRALLDPSTRQMARSWYTYFFQLPKIPEFMLRAGNFAMLKRAMRAIGRPGSFTREDLRRYVDAWKQPGTGVKNGVAQNGGRQLPALTAMLNYYRAAVREAVQAGQKKTIEESERRVRMPTLVLWGERDPALHPILAQWSIEWCDDGSLVRFPEASHWIQHDEPERVANRIVDFLEEVRLRPLASG